MLPANARLRRRDEFTQTVRGGQRAGRGGLVVHLDVCSEPAAGPVRAGFVVSKAVGNSVTRNLVARRLRHLVRDRLDSLPAGSRLVVRALPTAAERSFEVLGRDLDDALRRIRSRAGLA
jgi:ribonuclease P protein component